ncbi:vWA domain-containing protein [Rhodohalobacter sulfatireducens]|uniref:VWA domain-containing protein n=1 Tax=Rhodohalobacter sulfatireducens TaxID=2911366 RepID=A0ABS9KIG6_9BACT|nr:vWA domain-containing protein [Rhodohalobacter sulfatireducens]MCG2590638.1 VWA domain-containing protein [Rhodohalobacter sulfatireducens]
MNNSRELNYMSWYRHFKVYTVLALVIIFTSCDSTVVDNGNSLSSADFEEMQRSNHEGDLAPVCEAAVIDVSLVIDISGSNSGTRLQATKDGAKALVAELSSSDKGALISFSTTAQRNLDLTIMDPTGQSTLNQEIDDLTPIAWTNIQGGIIYGAEELTGDESLFGNVDTNPSGFDRDNATKVMVVLSDGFANRYYDSNGNVVTASSSVVQTETNNAATDAKNAGIRIFTIALQGANVPAMTGYASAPGDAFDVQDINTLVTVFSDIAEAICPTAVGVDIKPEGEPNSINPNNKGVIPVAILGSEDFDATTIDPVTVRFGALSEVTSDAGARLAHGDGHIEDVNGDGIPDFLGHFPTQDTGLVSGDLNGWLIGKTNDGESIAGFDAVKIVGGGKP